MNRVAIARRKLLGTFLGAPAFSGCAYDLSSFSGEPLPELATRMGICAASYVSLRAGVPSSAQTVSGCSSDTAAGSAAVFQAASLTKPLVAYLVLLLVTEGRLDLQAPVSNYLPTGYDHDQQPFGRVAGRSVDRVPASTLARIPLGSLLNHSAGFPNWASRELESEFAPGSRWQYAGEGYVMLQTVIGAVSGSDWETLVAQRVFEPLGMRHSWLRKPEDQGERVVQGRSRHGTVRQLDFHRANAAASLYTTASDYAKLLGAWLAERSLLSMATSRPIAVQPSLGLSWGYGWGIEAAEGGPYLWHWGNNPGFRAFVMLSATSGNGFVLLTNSDRGLALAAPLARTFVPAAHGVFRFHMLG